jgi:hypothetical protein
MTDQPIEGTVQYINSVVACARGEPVCNKDTFVNPDGTVEMWLSTSLTKREMDRIEEEYPIVEVYGFDPEHYHNRPDTAEEELGLIVSVA